jgi:ABC-type antimicrobial peptide transport system permease subunit
MSQDYPMKSGEKVSYVVGDIPAMLKEKYPEVEEYLRIEQMDVISTILGNEEYDPLTILMADASLPRFFPYEVLSGDLNEALTQPDKIALMENTARRLFGDTSPIGETISFKSMTGKLFTYRIAAVLKEREQSFLGFEAVTANPDNFGGGIALLLTNGAIDRNTFPEQLKKDKIPTVQMEIGQYYFSTLRESYFQAFHQESYDILNHQHPMLLYAGLASAILILLIACFNYVNLNFSRLFQQVRMIHIQKLMGASKGDIGRQLFLDTFLTVMIAFVLSVLLVHDLIPVFNSLVSGRLHTSFFFNGQTFPVIGGFILFLSVVPAVYMSRKAGKLSLSDYKVFFTGKRRNGIVATLSIAQFAISIALLMATITIYRQVSLIENGGKAYQDLIQIGSWSGKANFQPFASELRNLPSIEAITLSGASILNFPITQVIIKNDDGSETYYQRGQFMGGIDFFEAFNIELLQGVPPAQALDKYPNPVYINEKFVETLIPPGEDPVGKDLAMYDPSLNNKPDAPVVPVAGVVRNFFTNSLEEEVYPCVIYMEAETKKMNARFAYIRFGGNRSETLAQIRKVWEKYNSDLYFQYQDVGQMYAERNRKAFDLAHLLLMYSLISIFLTCFGLFGMALYATGQRTKEIGIRKVNGASAWQIMLLLNRRFVAWIAVAFAIASPIAWFFLHRWLESYVYRVEINPATFLLAGLLVLLITLLTVSYHSYRASSTNPVKALKSE